MNVDQLEIVCKQLYETADPDIRAEAEKVLFEFSNSVDCLSKCQQLLERANSVYAQLLAATTLTRLLTRPNFTLPMSNRLEIRNYVVNYLFNYPKLEGFVQQAIVLLFCRLTKIGWFDSDKEVWVFRNVISVVAKFLQSSQSEHVLGGVQLLSQLVGEMNQISESEANRSLTRHRKIASSFRDTQLFEIFRVGCQLLKEASCNLKTMDFNNQHQHGLLMHTLKLVHNCLTFDFIGTAADESSDDLCTVQIPTSWRTAFLDSESIQLFFNLYNSLPPSLSALTLACLVQVASIRRSLFNNTERARFLNCLVQGVKSILQNPLGLSDTANYHEFCRLVARLKSNYQLGELVKVDNYPEFIKLIAEFTVKSLQMWQFGPNSVHYLLSLWQRMVASVPYVKATEPHLLETFTPEITKAYITSRLDSVEIILRDQLEDPLDDQGMLFQQLDQLSTIGRCEYDKSCTLLVRLFDEAATRYQEMISFGGGSVAPLQLLAEEGRLAWLVYIIGAVIGGRVSFSSTDEHDTMDGELVCRVLQLMQLTDTRLDRQQGCQRLELALLSFFEQFRKIYVGDNVQKTSKVYRRLSEVLGLNEESMVLGVFINKIITNLKYWSVSEIIISRTLTLLSELSVGYSSVRKLVKLNAVQFMLTNHTYEHFPFLGLITTASMFEMKYRTTFYTALGRLLMVDLGEDEHRFEDFMRPLQDTFVSIGSVLMTPGASETQCEEAKRALVGLARDLRGVAFSLNTKSSYMMLFDWLYPDLSNLLIHAVDLWHREPTVTTPILKLYAEVAQNRSNRLQFDVSSPNGILLFREISKVMCTYGERLLSITESIPKEQVYAMKLKGISICFSILKAALCGNYVNFGVFSLYGDVALDNALNMFIRLLFSMRQSDLLDYPKLSQTYYALLECLAQDHMTFLAQSEASVFLYILQTIAEGLTALDTMVCAGCCATLDNILTYVFRLLQRRQSKRSTRPNQTSRQQQANDNMLHILELQPHIFQQMLSTALNIIMFEDCRNQWSMSRPLLGLILLNEKHFEELRSNIVASQSLDRQAGLIQCFEKLMDGIERSLLVKNRDKFTQNLSVFRRDVNDSMKNLSGYGGGDASPGGLVSGNNSLVNTNDPGVEASMV